MVELKFSKTGVLFEIIVAKGYQGTFGGAIKVGDSLSDVRSQFELFFDRGDEMHYAVGERGPKGISFFASEESEQDGSQEILAISIHDWAMSK